jgi:hypothetical protein
MNDGIKILLERIKTHPEEFTEEDNPFIYGSKWKKLFDKYRHSLPKEDVEEFDNAFNTLQREKFTAEVMAELLNPKQEEQLTLNPSLTANVTASGGVTLGQSTKLHELLHMKAQMELEKQKKKEHKTLFGKLFNYL